MPAVREIMLKSRSDIFFACKCFQLENWWTNLFSIFTEAGRTTGVTFSEKGFVSESFGKFPSICELLFVAEIVIIQRLEFDQLLIELFLSDLNLNLKLFTGSIVALVLQRNYCSFWVENVRHKITATRNPSLLQSLSIKFYCRLSHRRQCRKVACRFKGELCV